MKRALAVFGLLGLAGCFLPIAGGFSLFDARAFDAWGVYLLIAAFAVPMVIGLSDRLAIAGSVTAIGCFSYILLHRFGFDVLDLVWHGAIGARLMAVAAVGGFVSAFGSLAEASRR